MSPRFSFSSWFSYFVALRSMAICCTTQNSVLCTLYNNIFTSVHKYFYAVNNILIALDVFRIKPFMKYSNQIKANHFLCKKAY